MHATVQKTCNTEKVIGKVATHELNWKTKRCDYTSIFASENHGDGYILQFSLTLYQPCKSL